jgi:hypothetical protein
MDGLRAQRRGYPNFGRAAGTPSAFPRRFWRICLTYEAVEYDNLSRIEIGAGYGNARQSMSAGLRNPLDRIERCVGFLSRRARQTTEGVNTAVGLEMDGRAAQPPLSEKPAGEVGCGFTFCR